jgi:hypothetical protein
VCAFSGSSISATPSTGPRQACQLSRISRSVGRSFNHCWRYPFAHTRLSRHKMRTRTRLALSIVIDVKVISSQLQPTLDQNDKSVWIGSPSAPLASKGNGAQRIIAFNARSAAVLPFALGGHVATECLAPRNSQSIYCLFGGYSRLSIKVLGAPQSLYVTSSNPFGDNTSVPVPAFTSVHTTTPANPRFFHTARSQ